MIVFRRPRWEAAVSAVFAPVVGLALTIATAPFVWLPIVLLLVYTSDLPVDQKLLGSVVAVGGLFTLISLGNQINSLRWAVIFDDRTQTVAFRGLVWWHPWWRPRFGVLVVPVSSILHADRIRNYGRHGGWTIYRGVRVVTDRGIVMVPRSLRDWWKLTEIFSTIAAVTPAPPRVHTEAWLRQALVGFVLGINALLLAYVVMVFIPKTLG